jgi:hypothetical protein
MFNCDSATTNYRYYVYAWGGSIQTETTIVRTGGASDGTTPISWKIVTDTNADLYAPLLLDPIQQWNDTSGSSKTATIYLTSNTALDNSKIWVELEYANSSGAPLGAVTSSKVARLGTATALTTDSSTWGGSTTYKYKIAITFTPQAKGLVTARVQVGVTSTTIYVDPLMTIT